VPDAHEPARIDSSQASDLRRHAVDRLPRLLGALVPGSEDDKGNSPLHLACQPSRPERISLEFLSQILSISPLLDRRNQSGWSPLALAVVLLSAKAVALLAQGGQCDSPDAMQDALLLAANYERADVTAALLASGRICIDETHHNAALSFAHRFDRHAAYLLELDELAGRYPALDRAVADSEQTDSKVLKLLAGSKDRHVLRAVARNPNTPSETLLALAPDFPRPFFCNPAFDWMMLEDPDRIFKMGRGVIRKILRVKDCPASMIQWAVDRGSDADRLAVIRRGDVPSDILRAIAEKSSGRIKALAIATDPDAPEELLQTVVGIDVVADRLIADHRCAGHASLEKLVNSGDRVVREHLLRNPALSDAARLRLERTGSIVHLMGRK
jgi:hypothetical protein